MKIPNLINKSICLILILNFGIITEASGHMDGLCGTPPNPKSESTTKQKEMDQKLHALANLPGYAKKADSLLSQLITAKSPVIISWIKKRDLQSQSEEDLILEWRKYFAINFIIAKYPSNNTEMDLPVDFLFRSINKIFKEKTFVAKMELLFKKAKDQSIITINTYKIEPAAKNKIIARIGELKLYWADELKTSKFKTKALEFIDWGIAFDPEAKEINMGFQAIAYPNDETYIAVFAHEIGHSFDSARWEKYFSDVGPWPFAKVGNCLRSPESAGAKNQSNLQADQLPETFADWFSAETMAITNLASFANLRSDLCEVKSLNPGSSYLPNKDRLEKIYYANPILKNKLPSMEPNLNTKYCAF